METKGSKEMIEDVFEKGYPSYDAVHRDDQTKDKIPNTITKLSLEQLQELAWSWYKTMSQLERELKFSGVSRVEVIGPEGREYVRYFEDEEFMYTELQDDGRTLKIFIDEVNE